jgi:acetate kinase
MTADRLLDHPTLIFSDGSKIELSEAGHEKALKVSLLALKEKMGEVKLAGAGHRVVHGGEAFDRPVRITDEVENTIEELTNLAPLHNPVNLSGIRIARDLFPDIDHFAIFDTAFHQSMPRRAKTYALPKDVIEKYGIRRYGFHGMSHQYVARQAAIYLHDDLRNLRIITCHLGNGCSVAALEFGRSVETSMGMTPLEGLVMGTRSGDVDPGILTFLREQHG